MKKKNIYFLIIILLLVIFAGFFDYPKAWDKGADFLSAKTGFKIPHFPSAPFKLGLDLQGGTHLVYQTDLSGTDKADYSNSLQGLRDVIERRVNLFGVSEPVVQIEESSQRLVVELAGIKDVNQAIQMIGQTPFLEFKEQRSQEETQKILDKQKEIEGKTLEEAEKVQDWQLAFEDPYFKSTPLTGQYLKKADVVFDSTTSRPQISLQFNDEGAKIFEDLTAANVGRPIAIYIDQNLISAPNVQEKIAGGKAQITGNFTIEEARKMARNLNAGALPVPIKLISQQTVGPILGAISLEKSLKAGFIGFLAIILFMIIFYRIPGVLASMALVIYVILLLAFFKIISVTLTLAGIAGLILSIGMAVDANILIFARMKEELLSGKPLVLAVEDGFRRAWPSIRDSNANSIIVTLILFSFGVGFVKGFALTLMIGIILSMFSAIFLTRNFLRIVLQSRIGKIIAIW